MAVVTDMSDMSFSILIVVFTRFIWCWLTISGKLLWKRFLTRQLLDYRFSDFKLFVPCIFSTYGMQTNWCHYFIRILLDLYMFRAHRPIFRRVRTAVDTTIGSVSVLLCLRSLYVDNIQSTRTEWYRYWTNGCVNSCKNAPEDEPVGPKRVEIQQYTNKIVTSVGFHSIYRFSGF